MKDFEPFASTFEERIEVLNYLKQHEFNVNIMMEPYLSDPIKLSTKLLKILPPTGIIAIGQMNYMSNIKMTPQQKEYLEELYSDANVKKLWKFTKERDDVYLKKDSTKRVMSST